MIDDNELHGILIGYCDALQLISDRLFSINEKLLKTNKLLDDVLYEVKLK